MPEYESDGGPLLRRGKKLGKTPAFERFAFCEVVCRGNVFEGSRILDVQGRIGERFREVVERNVPPGEYAWYELKKDAAILDILRELSGGSDLKLGTMNLARLIPPLIHVPGSTFSSPTQMLGFAAIESEIWAFTMIIHDGAAIVWGGFVVEFKNDTVVYESELASEIMHKGSVVFGNP